MSFLPLRTSHSDDSKEDLEGDIYNPPHANLVRKVFYYAFILALCSGWIVAFGLSRRPNLVSFPGLSSPHPFPPEIFTRVRKVFQPDEQYIGPSNRTHHNWDHLVAGHDALYIENPTKYGLMKGIPPPFHHENMAHPVPRKFYVVPLLHQMHCLNIVRFHYWQIKKGHSVVSEYSEASWDAHVDHCFEYLRQAISCGSGFTIEGDSPLFVEGEHGEASTVTGWGIEHDCINFEALRAFQIEQERIYNTTWRE